MGKLKWGVAGLGLLALGACNQINPNVATPNEEVIGINAYNAAVATATAYLQLPICGVPPCRTKVLSQSVYTALKSGRVARNQVLAALAANQAAPLTALQALQAAYAVVQQIPQQ
jgi:hypothetical protein